LRSEDSDDSQALLSRLVREIGQSRKYRELEIPVETLKDLLEQELGNGSPPKQGFIRMRNPLKVGLRHVQLLVQTFLAMTGPQSMTSRTVSFCRR